jgi:hypothetical protein
VRALSTECACHTDSTAAAQLTRQQPSDRQQQTMRCCACCSSLFISTTKSHVLLATHASTGKQSCTRLCSRPHTITSKSLRRVTSWTLSTSHIRDDPATWQQSAVLRRIPTIILLDYWVCITAAGDGWPLDPPLYTTADRRYTVLAAAADLSTEQWVNSCRHAACFMKSSSNTADSPRSLARSHLVNQASHTRSNYPSPDPQCGTETLCTCTHTSPGTQPW